MKDLNREDQVRSDMANNSFFSIDKEKLSSITNAATIALEKAKRAQLIQEKIRQRINALNTSNFNTANIKPTYSDSQIPESRDTEFISITATEENNRRALQNADRKWVGLPNLDLNEEKGDVHNIDLRIVTKKKIKKGLRFIREGIFIKKEQELNNPDSKVKKKKKRVEELIYSNDLTIFSKVHIPELESWDLPFVKRKENVREEEFPFEILESKINNLIEHPIPIEPHYDPNEVATSTIFLTPKERAKLRRIKRREKETEKQDRIRMGLEPPPPPKMKLSNLLNIYNDKSISNPSKIEMQIRTQIEERVKAHEDRNSARQLTKEERSKKKADKWKLDPSSPIVHAAIFSIDKLSNKRHIFKIDKNAHDCHLTGCCLINSIGSSIIFIEGSKKSLKFYKNLLLNRVKWNESTEQTTCDLIWEGTQPSKRFQKWKLYYCHSNEDAYQFLSDNNSLDLWNISLSYANISKH